MTEPSLHRLQQCLQQSPPNLAEAALILALPEYPTLDIAYYLQRLDAFAAQVNSYLLPDSPAVERLYALNQVLFTEQGFTGNREDYYNPRNSFLNDVLETRCGIPITLSIVYLEVGRRIGLALEGISFPGHFLVKLAVEDGEIILDPFINGISLDEEELLQRLRSNYGNTADTELLILLLQPASVKDILVRLLHNLKAIYSQTQQTEKMLTVLNQLLVIAPQLAETWRDRGLLYEQLECFHSATQDLQYYLQLKPKAEDFSLVQSYLLALQAQTTYLH